MTLNELEEKDETLLKKATKSLGDDENVWESPRVLNSPSSEFML